MRQVLGVWAVALALAALGTAVLFQAAAGANWAIWTFGAVAAIGMWARQAGGRVASASRPTLALAAALAAATPLTAADCFHALIACAVAALLAMALLLAREPRWARVTLPFMLWAPIVAPLRALLEAIARARELVAFAATSGNRAPLRGTALALPIVALFAVILANAADTFRGMLRWRYSATSLEPACRWFEWNLRRRQAADAVRAAGLVAEPVQLGPRACS